MTDKQKYNNIFSTIFEVPDQELGTDFNADTVNNWDSITQLTLVTEIEDQFGIMLDTDDILNFKSYSGGMEILLKYGINLEK